MAEDGDPGPADRTVTRAGADALPDIASIGGAALGAAVEMASNGPLHTPVARVFEAAVAGRAYEHSSGSHGGGRTVLSFT